MGSLFTENIQNLRDSLQIWKTLPPDLLEIQVRSYILSAPTTMLLLCLDKTPYGTCQPEGTLHEHLEYLRCLNGTSLSCPQPIPEPLRRLSVEHHIQLILDRLQ